MNKRHAYQRILAKLEEDLEVALRAARTAHEAATHEESIAENKYDTLGLEASYLAAGQARRVEEIRQSLALFQNLVLRNFDAEQGIQTSALVELADADGRSKWLFLGPDAAGLKIELDGQEVLVITPRSPLGGALLNRQAGDELEVGSGSARQTYEITQIL
ncbi:GreA/GreB family elongation factor [Pseudomonas panipatensis]|uniref:Transcription elongation factor, GreA/GreB, C-term n=1 Tax=Pseudomonas panipatensis TaxID=428992 RepID=A0A1G8GM43_9PSED|nr:GreA/GreB family elongation factor [Pseudomonas panipatensis]SDH95377.1 Transcription elongation factor, GreA/GreB, C-term [Pseudomonas panipatensis]SMP42543.1 GreA/GreB family elongation factor [Pseudomonas panipatensis]